MTYMNALKPLCFAALTATAVTLCSAAFAAPAEDGLYAESFAAMKGKKVVYMPNALGYDLTEGWLAGLKNEAARLGFEVIVRDPNWNIDAGVQAMQAVVREKPDLLVVQPPDVTSYSRLIQKAQEAGVPVIEVNQMTTAVPDVFVGADWYAIGVANGEAVVKACGQGSGKSGKVAIVQGLITAPASITQVRGINDVFAKHPEIKVVSNQAADWTPSKSNSITTTVLQQNPDLCAIIEAWDGQAVGSATAIHDAGKQGQVFLATSGGGEKTACDNVANGSFTHYVSFDLWDQDRDINNLVKLFLQGKFSPGKQKLALYTPNHEITKENLSARSCWTMDEVKKSGG
ncbi:MAG TPA: sugar ABC transporter substrate-binding protein [Magnetospirillaceae bacterium]